MPQTLMQLNNSATLAVKPSLLIYSPSHDSHGYWQKWLPNFQWQASVQIQQVRQWLLEDGMACLLVDMRQSPQRMLGEINQLKASFNNITIVAVVAEEDLHHGQLAVSQGADAYVCSQHINGAGLECLCESFMQRSNKQTQLVSASTGLMNYALYYDRLNHALQLAKRHKTRTAILLVSINQYHLWTQQYDESKHDTLLNQFADVLLKQIRKSDGLTYLQQGTFGIVLEGLKDEVMAAQIARKVQQRCSNDVSIEGEIINLACCVGVYICESDELNGEALHQQAYSALTRAQQKDSQGLWFYGQDINSKIMARFDIESALNRALEQQEFFVQYQPCHTSKGEIINVLQPLLCWMHPSAGLVMPDAFSHLLEVSDSLTEVNFWYINKILSEVKQWQIDGHWSSRQQVFIPVNQRLLRCDNLSEQLHKKVVESGLKFEQLILQFDEKTVLDNLRRIKELLSRNPGVSVAVELQPLQSGYGSLTYLKALDVEFICLHKSFFKHVYVDAMQVSMVRNIVNLANDLGIDVLAFGADNPALVEKMKGLGCASLSGDHFGHEVNAKTWPDYLLAH